MDRPRPAPAQQHHGAAGGPGNRHRLEPVGRRRYWPIYRAIAESGLPLGIHSGGFNGRAPVPGSGWCSFLAEQHHLTQINMQQLVSSMIMEGVLEEFPTLRIAIYEGGLVWVPALGWRLDNLWSRLRAEVPHVTRPPSEYIRERFWFSTQPIDDAERPGQLRETLEWIGFDRILFATDYPHWDFDDPATALRIPLSAEERHAVLAGNAHALFRLDR
jgi:predicted TIM-barrel fold metal-dependent hydrolase